VAHEVIDLAHELFHTVEGIAANRLIGDHPEEAFRP
jgi:hypothetical protein